MTEQQLAFWDTISVFHNEGLLPYVMLIGSWAEYIYQHHLATGYQANLRTRDVDFLYPNLNRPQNKQIRIVERMEEKDIQSVKELLHYINVDRLKKIYSEMPKKVQKKIDKTQAEHFIGF